MFGAADFHTVQAEIRDEAEVAVQAAAFEQQLELSVAAGKSVVVHQRDSWEDTIELLRKYSRRVRAVAHGFDAGPEQAEELLDLGHFVSFSGIVTFENAGEVRERPSQSRSIELWWKAIPPILCRYQIAIDGVNLPFSARLPPSLLIFVA